MNFGPAESLLGLLALAGIYQWSALAMRARERARALAERLCSEQHWQLLDQTVALIALRPVRHNGRWRWRRRYRFEFSTNGNQRRRGEIQIINRQLVRLIADLGEGQSLIE